MREFLWSLAEPKIDRRCGLAILGVAFAMWITDERSPAFVAFMGCFYLVLALIGHIAIRKRHLAT